MSPNKYPQHEEVAISTYDSLKEKWQILLGKTSHESYTKPLSLVAPDGRKLRMWKPIPSEGSKASFITVECEDMGVTNIATITEGSENIVVETGQPGTEPTVSPFELIALVEYSEIDPSVPQS